MKKDSQKVFKYLLSLTVSDKEIIETVEEMIKARDEFETMRARLTKIHIKDIFKHKMRAHFLVVRSSALGRKLSTNEVMDILKIPPKYKRSIDNYLCENFDDGLFLREKEESAKIRLKFIPMKRKKKGIKGRPAYLYGIDMEKSPKVLEMYNNPNKEIVQLCDMVGLTKSFNRFLKQLLGNKEFARLMKESSDALTIEIPPKSR